MNASVLAKTASRFALLTLAGSLFAFSASPLAAQTVVDEIVARVDDQIITRADVQRSREQTLSELKQQSPADADKKMAERDKDILRDLIDQQLLLAKGKEEGITGDTELIKQLDDIRKRNHLDSMEDLEKEAGSQGVSFEDFKQSLKNNIITQQVIGQDVGHKVKITPADIQAYYDKHKAEMERPEAVHLAEILVSTETPAPAADATSGAEKPETTADPAKVAAAEAKANSLLEQLKKGAAFDELAKKNSDGPTAVQGGDLGVFKRGTLAKELEDKTFSLKTGETSGVVRTKQGFIILKVLEHQDAGIPALKDVERDIEETLYYERLQPALREYLTQLREDSYVDVKPGYVDTGASPKQTKPVITTVASNEGKKAKKHKKLGVF